MRTTRPAGDCALKQAETFRGNDRFDGLVHGALAMAVVAALGNFAFEALNFSGGARRVAVAAENTQRLLVLVEPPACGPHPGTNLMVAAPATNRGAAISDGDGRAAVPAGKSKAMTPSRTIDRGPAPERMLRFLRAPQ
ncbi:MAG TPA: hypothetical protein VI454_13920 [Verrucomicrobiae bacterium]|jgi:hypothetical protein